MHAKNIRSFRHVIINALIQDFKDLIINKIDTTRIWQLNDKYRQYQQDFNGFWSQTKIKKIIDGNQTHLYGYFMPQDLTELISEHEHNQFENNMSKISFTKQDNFVFFDPLTLYTAPS